MTCRSWTRFETARSLVTFEDIVGALRQVGVAGGADRTCRHIPQVGDLPLGCAAVCNASISVATTGCRCRP